MVCCVTTSTDAGVCITGRPKRVALCGTSFSAVIGMPAKGCVGDAVGGG
jgi:hypothetical protein